MISRRDFLKIAGLSAVSFTAGFKVMDFFGNSKVVSGTVFTAFLPADSKVLSKFFELYKSHNSVVINGNSPVIVGDGEPAAMVSQILNGKAGNGFFVSAKGVNSNINSDLLIYDKSGSIVTPESGFTSNLQEFRAGLHGKTAGVMITVKEINDSKPADYAVIESDNKVYDKIRLGKNKEISLNTGAGEMVVAIAGNSVSVKKAACKHKLCQSQGSIYDTNSQIACAPGKVLIKLETA
ncbi:MAG: NusG domain II-containing protein [Ignavibacteriaceae bacterium]|nr:NusG domain II-containing protein [Ignavibacteriaceae bacterium]